VFLVVLVMATLSESAYYLFMQNESITLSSSVTLFAAMIFPFPSVVVIAFTFLVVSRAVGFLRKEIKNIFDMKALFNFCTFIILAKCASLVFNYFDYSFINSEDQVIMLIAMSLGYNMLNYLITYTVISLNIGVNVFKDFERSEIIIFNFYSMMFTFLLWFGYSSYGLKALVFMAILVIPLQRSIIMQTKSEEINQRLIEDPLTHAYNRQYFEDLMYEKLDKQMEFGLIFLDLDRFKNINDTYGHLIGDEVLVDLVTKIKSFLRKGDAIVRYGGDEFCIITYDMTYCEILMELIKKNKEQFCHECAHGKIHYSFTMSLTLYDGEHRNSYRNIMQVADRGMYERKQVS